MKDNDSGGGDSAALQWRRSGGKYPSMRTVIAEGEHPQHGKFNLGLCVFTGALWVGLTPAGGKSAWYSLGARGMMEDFFRQLEAGGIAPAEPD